MLVIAKESLRGTRIILPELGEIEIPENGELNFEDESVATSLIEGNMGYTSGIVKPVAEDEGSKDENVFTKESLSQLSLEELIELAKTSGLPEAEWEKLSKNTSKPTELMVNYLFKKINA
jgi:hypothetical protein